jgi:hypothetical protein
MLAIELERRESMAYKQEDHQLHGYQKCTENDFESALVLLQLHLYSKTVPKIILSIFALKFLFLLSLSSLPCLIKSLHN